MTELITIKQLKSADSYGAMYGSFDSKFQLLTTHFCSNHTWAKRDLGEGRKKLYDELFPEGWEVVCEWEKE